MRPDSQAEQQGNQRVARDHPGCVGVGWIIEKINENVCSDRGISYLALCMISIRRKGSRMPNAQPEIMKLFKAPVYHASAKIQILFFQF